MSVSAQEMFNELTRLKEAGFNLESFEIIPVGEEIASEIIVEYEPKKIFIS